ncbi:S-layer domain-containing protein [Caldicellulosiruptor owensensis OL]|uniref:S-layer domain-containing protein n=1 Tax=Caldicellulosiruptor owensensis (strain ATCC 700167 / DSM 13100 / OL) TaxID=632518 RepID=E4Q5T2_CALOW|nr:S-layer homology domain-containing protein [Caldicellulosiruptor owensensis]ADQ05491.1 S-layer domain-containing protein [Caldicellulosiruptor owensensis OL]
MASYQDGTGKNWFVNLVTAGTDNDLTVAATDFATKYVATVGDVSKAEYQLTKIYAAITVFKATGVEYKPLVYSESTGMFSINVNGLNNLIALLVGVLGNPIENQQNIDNIKTAFQTIVNAVNSITSSTEKLGAKALLQALGLLYVESVPSAGGGIIVPGTGAGTSTPGTSTGESGTQQPSQPVQTAQPSTLSDVVSNLDAAISQGKLDQIDDIINVLPTVLSAEKDADKAVSGLSQALEKIASVLNKISNVTEIKSIVSGLTNAINVVASNIEKQSVSTVEKTLKLENLKFETAGLLLKAYEAVAVTPLKAEEATKVTFKVSANDVTTAISRANEMVSAAQKITNATLKKSLNFIGFSVAINANTNKEVSVLLEKDAIDKIKNDSKITNILVVTPVASIAVPTSIINADNVEIKIKPVQVSNALSQAVEVNVVVGGKAQEKFDKTVVLVLKLSNKIADESKVAVYRVVDDKTEIVPGIYVSTTNSFLVERKSLSTYYVGSYNKTYSDVDSKAWYYKNIQLVSAKGITNGYPDGTFRPNSNVTRAEFAKMVVETFQFDTAGQAVSKFEDVKESDWFYPYVATLYNLGIINGRSETKFAPNEPVTREEMAKMISLALSKAGKVSISAIPTLSFADEPEIAGWAKKYVAVVVENGIMEGRGNSVFAPKANATRAEVATVIVRALVK